MSEEIKTEIEKRIEAGAKFILEMPELDALKLFLEFASNEKASRREVSFHARELLESLKKAGLV